MKTIALVAVATLLSFGVSNAATPQCPNDYSLVLSCKNTNKPVRQWEDIPPVPSQEFVLCTAKVSPMFALVTDKPAHKDLKTQTFIVNDSMFLHELYGAFTDSQQKIAISAIPIAGPLWRIFTNPIDDLHNLKKGSVSEYNCLGRWYE